MIFWLDNFLKKSYLKVIHLAKSEKNLFRLIYLSEYCSGNEFIQNRMSYESNNRILKELMERYQLDEKEGKDVLQRSSLLIQGIATLLATTNIVYSDHEVCNMVEQTILDMVSGIKAKINR